MYCPIGNNKFSKCLHPKLKLPFQVLVKYPVYGNLILRAKTH